jgi:hypothetical protein
MERDALQYAKEQLKAMVILLEQEIGIQPAGPIVLNLAAAIDEIDRAKRLAH